MKYLSLILIISSLHSLAFASDFTVTTDDPEIDFSSLDKNILIKIEKNELPTRRPTAEYRDQILKRHIPHFVEKSDEFERELFYNDLFNYSHQKLKNKYDFLDEKTIFNLKQNFLIK